MSSWQEEAWAAMDHLREDFAWHLEQAIREYHFRTTNRWIVVELRNWSA